MVNLAETLHFRREAVAGQEKNQAKATLLPSERRFPAFRYCGKKMEIGCFKSAAWQRSVPILRKIRRQ
jgi:hypothetical protein